MILFAGLHFKSCVKNHQRFFLAVHKVFYVNVRLLCPGIAYTVLKVKDAAFCIPGHTVRE